MSSPKLTVVGTPFSTFTRTITLGLSKKGLSWDFIITPSHAPKADKYHPLGHLPTLIIHNATGDDIWLRESQAIVRYIDRIVPNPSLHLAESNADVVLPEKMWEFVSIIQSNAYKITEVDVIKVRVGKTDEGKLRPEEIAESIAGPVEELRTYLSKVEPLMAPSGFVFGKSLTWADYFLYPLLADLEATPEAHLITPRLQSWLSEMKKLDEVKATEEGTLAVGGRPPAPS